MCPGRFRSVGRVAGIDQRAHGSGTVVRRDTGRRAVAVVDRHGERGALRFGVRHHHERQVELVGALGLEGYAEDPRRVLEEKGHALGRDVFGGHDEVAFVLTVFVVNNDHHAAVTQLRNRFFDCGETPSNLHVNADIVTNSTDVDETPAPQGFHRTGSKALSRPPAYRQRTRKGRRLVPNDVIDEPRFEERARRGGTALDEDLEDVVVDRARRARAPRSPDSSRQGRTFAPFGRLTEHDAQRFEDDVVETRGEARIVAAHRARADHDRLALSAQEVSVTTSLAPR